jgi:hypothetical protein
VVRIDGVAATVTRLVSFEILDLVRMPGGRGPLPALWHRTLVAMVRIETVVYVAIEVGGAVKPGPSANEDAANKPFRAVVTVGSARIGSIVKVSVRAYRRGTDIDGDLSLGLSFGSGGREADSSKSSQQEILESVHKFSSLLEGPGGHLRAVLRRIEDGQRERVVIIPYDDAREEIVAKCFVRGGRVCESALVGSGILNCAMVRRRRAVCHFVSFRC